MGLGKITLKVVRGLFRNPLRKGAKSYEQIPMGLSILYAGVQGGRAIFDIYNGNNSIRAKQKALDGYVGLAAAAGSILGPAGTVLFGSTMYALTNDVKKKIVA